MHSRLFKAYKKIRMSKIQLKPMVSVVMTTYNHYPYIREAIEGVLMQKTDFPVELIIGEDCSNDDTRKIVEEYSVRYPEKIKPIFNEKSLGFLKNYKNTLQAVSGKYIAFCEGDDYWTDPLKLQKQVDFMETNLSYVACFHKYQEIEGTTIRNEVFPDIEEDFVVTKSNFFKNWYTKTLTVLLRSESFYKIDVSNYQNPRDTSLFYELLKINNAMCLNFVGGVYRLHSTGVWSLKEEKERDLISYITIEEIYYNNPEDEVVKNFVHRLLNRILEKPKFSIYKVLILNTKSFYFKKFLLKRYLREKLNLLKA